MAEKHICYQIVVRTHLGASRLTCWPVVSYAASFDACHVPITTMTLEVVDQAQLIGLLNELHGVGIDLLSLQYAGMHP